MPHGSAHPYIMSSFFMHEPLPSFSHTDPERTAMGVEGLDDILNGGLPKHRLYLVQGDPGVGKTTMAMQFLLEGVKRGEKVLYITLSETKEEIELIANSHGWDISGINLFEMASLDGISGEETDNTFFHPSEVELNRVVNLLLEDIGRLEPARIVFDSLSELRLLAETPLRYRRLILQLKQYFAGRKITVLLLDDKTASAGDLHIESIAHGVLTFTRVFPEYGVARRQMLVQKLRGSAFREGRHDFLLRKGGMAIFPRLVAADHVKKTTHQTLSTGIEGLDQLLGGGFDFGTSTMLLGPSGSGKSTLILKMLEQAADQGIKSMLYIFDETVGNLLTRATGLQINIASHIESGMIEIKQVDPAEVSPGELTHHIRTAVSVRGVRLVAIDSINGYMNAMPEERFLDLQLHEMFTYLGQQGVVTIAVYTQHGIMGAMKSTVDLTYLADSVIMFRYFEAKGTVRQAISVLKKRTGTHERTIREMRVTQGGIEVGEPLHDMQGVLTGVPVFLNEAGQTKSNRGIDNELLK